MTKAAKAFIAALAVGLFGCGVFCQQTLADPSGEVNPPIQGAIQFFGSATASGASDGSPVTIHFINPWNTLQATGDYAGVPFGTDTTFSDFIFTGDGASATLSGAVVPLWTFTDGGLTYSFDLLQLTNGHTEAGSMTFSGVGVAHITGFEDTIASFGLQATGNNFSFEIASSTTAAIPEGATAALFVLGGSLLVAIQTWRRKRPVA